MLLTVNVDIIPYVIKENLHVEYFLWCYFKQLNLSGYHSVDELPLEQFCLSTLAHKSKDNPFYIFRKSKFILKSRKGFENLTSHYYYSCEYCDLIKYARFFSTSLNKKSKQWNSTTIKYFLISVYACRHGNKKPYALDLVGEDLDVSPKTVQRAVGMFGVKKHHKPQKKYSPRSYHITNGHVSFSANYNKMPIGRNLFLKF